MLNLVLGSPGTILAYVPLFKTLDLLISGLYLCI
jgi:hypothetical protein